MPILIVNIVIRLLLKDVEVMLIKSCDRAHNLETIFIHPQQKQQKILEETSKYFFPIFFKSLSKSAV